MHVRRLAIAILAVLGLSWIWVLAGAGSSPEVYLDRDWIAFHRAGQRLIAGDWSTLYGIPEGKGFWFLYPPYALPLFAPLGWMSPPVAYGACVAFGLACTVVWFRGMRALHPGAGADLTTAALVVFSSAPFVSTVVTGQLGPMYLAVLAAAGAAWRRERPGAAGLMLSLLALKPNLLVFPALLMLYTRQWRAVGGMAAGAAALVAAGLAFGTDLWADFFHTTSALGHSLRTGGAEMWKHQTVYAFWKTLLPASPVWLADAAWALSAIGLVVVAARGVRGQGAGRRARLLSVAVLLMVAASPYAWFYDALLLALPATVWYVAREQYASRRLHRASGVCVLGIYLWTHLNQWILAGPWTFTGPLTAAWLVVECQDLRRSSR